jgi:hypothetical protein
MAELIGNDRYGYPTGWENVTPDQLQAIGITNPAILKSAQEGKLDNPTFGSLNLDARVVQNALNQGQALPEDFRMAQGQASFKDAPAGQVVATHPDASGGVKYWYENGGSVVYKDGQPIEVSPAFSAYRKVEGDRNLAVADNPGFTVFNGQIVPVNANQYQWNPETQSPETRGGVPSGYRAPKNSGFFESIGSSLADFDSSVRETVPGGWATLAGAGALIAAPYLAPYLSQTAGAAGAAGAAGGAAGGAATGSGMLASLGLGAEAALPFTSSTAPGLFSLGGASAAGSGFAGLTPEFAAELGLSGGSGLGTAGASGNVLSGIYGAEGAGLLSKAKDVYQGVKLAGALRDAFEGGGSMGTTMGSGGYRGGNYNYQNLPFLQAPQQEGIFAQTGPNVSGFGQTQDTRRNANLMANLLRG